MRSCDSSNCCVPPYSHPQGLNDEALIATLLRDALRGIEYIHSQVPKEENTVVVRECCHLSVNGPFWFKNSLSFCPSFLSKSCWKNAGYLLYNFIVLGVSLFVMHRVVSIETLKPETCSWTKTAPFVWVTLVYVWMPSLCVYSIGSFVVFLETVVP